MTTRTVLDRLPSVVITIAIVLILGTLAMAASPRFRAFLQPVAAPAYGPGDHFEGPAPVTALPTRALVVVAGPNCGATERSYAFLAQAVSTATAAGISVWLYTPEGAHPEIAQYAAGLGINREHIVAVDPAATRLRIMPSLALLDRDHTVVNFWQSAPDAETGEAILHTLRPDVRK